MTVEAFVLNLPPPKPLRLAGSAVFLDLDGTLAPIAPRPQGLVALHRIGTRDCRWRALMMKRGNNSACSC